MSTEEHDFPQEREFRVMVRLLREMGYGRMVQIVDEEWRADPRLDVPQDAKGLKVICTHCGELTCYAERKRTT